MGYLFLSRRGRDTIRGKRAPFSPYGEPCARHDSTRLCVQAPTPGLVCRSTFVLLASKTNLGRQPILAVGACRQGRESACRTGHLPQSKCQKRFRRIVLRPRRERNKYPIGNIFSETEASVVCLTRAFHRIRSRNYRALLQNKGSPRIYQTAYSQCVFNQCKYCRGKICRKQR